MIIQMSCRPLNWPNTKGMNASAHSNKWIHIGKKKSLKLKIHSRIIKRTVSVEYVYPAGYLCHNFIRLRRSVSAHIISPLALSQPTLHQV